LSPRLFLFSIKPVYANAILSGVKRFELRRGSGNDFSYGDIVVIYASGRVKSIVGEFTVGRVFRGSPLHIWRIVSSRRDYGIGRDAWQYIEGGKRAFALEVLNPRPYDIRLSLYEVRSVLPSWNPPLGYRVLLDGDPFYELFIKPLRRRNLPA
jgi:predicted transcriptional regulator